jgi:hypothetical protein
MPILIREANGNRYVLNLALPDDSLITVERDPAPCDFYAVRAISEDGIPASHGRAPTMADLEELAELLARYEQAVFQLILADELDALGLRFDIPKLSSESMFKSLRVAKRADDSGLLAPILQRIGS